MLKNDPDWSILQLPTGQFDFVEVYGSGFDDERLVPSGVSSMVSFGSTISKAHTERFEQRDTK